MRVLIKKKTSFYIAAASDDCPQAFDLLLTALSGNLAQIVTTAIFDSEKAIITEELLGYMDSEARALEIEFAQLCYGNTPLGRGDVTGTLESLQNISIEDVRNYISENYVPTNAYLVITGAFTDKLFASANPQVLESTEDTYKPQSKPKSQVAFIPKEMNQNRIMVGAPLPKGGAKHAVAKLIYVSLLEEYLEYFARQKGYVYQLQLNSLPYRDHTYLVIDAQCSPGKTKDLYLWLNGALNKFVAEINTDLFQIYKGNYIKNCLFDLGNAKASLDTLSWYYYYFDELITGEKEIDMINQLKLDEIHGLHETFLNSKPRTVLIAGDIPLDLQHQIRSAG